MLGTTSTTATALKQYWVDMFIENLYDSFALKGLTKMAKVSKNSGTTVWWVGIGKVDPAGAASSEGADPTARSSRASRVSGVLTEYVNLIKNSKLFSDTAIDGTKEAIIKDLAKDAAITLDTVLYTKALAGGTVLYANGKAARNSIAKADTATVRDIRKAVNLLQKSGVPTWPDGYYVGLVHADVGFDIQSDSAWVDINKYRDSVKNDISGEIGRLYGVRFALAPAMTATNNFLINSGSASRDVYRTLIFGPDFLGQADLGEVDIVINEPGKTSELGQFNTYGYRFVSSSAVLTNSRCVRLESSASLGS
ncbi:MAG: hypothetical protein UT43_C0001G0033 [Parcubacteria group bacterium GW2011_GWC1_39_29]|nr:MAG: hypothetical protein UT43_C0001G0033 [Parcubacteria group bacterium GW2011_GWC1_39_29]